MTPLSSSSRSALRFERILLLILIGIAAYLRLDPMGSVSLGNDELSALQRLKFDSFFGMIDKGVRPDGHPALVQAFLYAYTGLVGTSSEFLLRLPFAIASVLGLFFAYRLIRSRASGTAALLAVGFLAASAFPVLYARLARPYAFGFLFILLFAFYHDRFLRSEDRREEARWMPMFALSGALCVLTHYFCGLTAILLGVIGFFQLRSGALRNYIISGVGAFLLFSPHLGITIDQISKGGVGGEGGWLAPPDISFFSDHFLRVFNESGWVALACLLLPLLLSRSSLKSRNSLPWTFLLVFLLPLLIGYAYSIWVNPVLQDSVLLFSMPFFPLYFFSNVRELAAPWMKAGLVLLFTVGLGVHTVSSVWYYDTPTNGNFKAIAERYMEWHDEYGASKIERAASMTSAAYLDHYLRERPDLSAPKLSNLEYDKDLDTFIERVQSSKKPYFAYAWASSANRPIYRELIREKYPRAIEDHRYFNSGITLYSKEGQDERERLWKGLESFDGTGSAERDLKAHRSDAAYRSSPFSYRMSSSDEYGPKLRTSLKGSIDRDGSVLVKATAHIKGKGSFEELRMVVSYEVGDSTYMWRANSEKLFQRWDGGSGWKEFFALGILYHDMPRGGSVECYLWNRGGRSFLLDDMELELMPWWDMNDPEEYLRYRQRVTES